MTIKHLFVDFALISFKTKVTGIPRVTFEYFTRFLEKSLQTNEWIVHPVYIEEIGVLKSAAYNLPQELTERYFDYLGKMAERHPDLELEKLVNLIRMQLAEALPMGKVNPSSPLPLRRRLAHLRRGMLARIVSSDPILKKAVKAYVGGIATTPASMLPTFGQIKLVGDQIFHQPIEGDVLFMPAYWHDIQPMCYFTLQQSGVVIVPMLHDLLPVIIPEKYEKKWSRLFHFNVFVTCLLADAIVSISRATREDLGRLMESHSYPHPDVFVQHHGFDFQTGTGAAAESKRFPADGRYLLMVGSIEPKKNHSLVIDEFIKIAQRKPGVRLKIIGFPGWMHEEITRKIATTIRKGHPVDYYQNVNDGELATAYRNALATVMASSHEGFGLPVIESMSLGCPVLLSDIPVFREIAGDSGTYFSLEKPESLAEAIEKLLGAERPARIVDFSWPTWDDRAGALFEWLISRPSRNRTVYGKI